MITEIDETIWSRLSPEARAEIEIATKPEPLDPSSLWLRDGRHAAPDTWRQVFVDSTSRRPEERAETINTIERAMDLFYSPDLMALLPGNFIAHLAEHDLPQMAKVVGEKFGTRAEQSYSEQRSKGK